MAEIKDVFLFYQRLMDLALIEARRAYGEGEVPVGAVLWFPDGTLLTERNRMEACMNPLAHAEMRLLQKATQKFSRHELPEAVLAVTLEPCPMCAGAITMARIGTLVFGARDPRYGACGSRFDIFGSPDLNHRPVIVTGIREWECRILITAFFRMRRREGRVESFQEETAC